MKKTLILVLIFTILLSTVIFAAPGDTTDPIVVLSYLNQRLTSLVNDYKLDTIKNMQAKIDSLESKLSSGNGGTSGGTANSGSNEFAIVKINAGEKIIAQSGTELILRGGEAYIIGSDLGGITDVTAGYDFTSDMKVRDNHYLIIPRSDGRGVYTKDYALFMVRGAYEVVKN